MQSALSLSGEQDPEKRYCSYYSYQPAATVQQLSPNWLQPVQPAVIAESALGGEIMGAQKNYLFCLHSSARNPEVLTRQVRQTLLVLSHR